jgi:hypothetical protein
MAAVRRAAARHGPFMLAPLRLMLLSGFPVLSAKAVMEPFFALEKSLLETLSPMFLPPDPQSLARRGKLNSRQIENFWKWGYPFVLNDHRFHLTLGDVGSSDEYIKALKGYFAPSLLNSLAISKVSLCVQNAPDGKFMLLKDFPLSKTNAHKGAFSKDGGFNCLET